MTETKYSESTICMLLFDMTQSQVAVIKDDKYRQMVKQTFNRWFNEGRKLWKLQGNVIANTPYEESFEQLSTLCYDALREVLAADDPVTAVALLKAYNQGHVTPIEDELPDGVKTERQLAELSSCN